jgi:excinuclease ABC subunit C
MMEEVLRRRFTRGLTEGGLPDLVLVDGGKGQLSVAVKLVEELKVPDLEVLALAKERRARGTVERVRPRTNRSASRLTRRSRSTPADPR